MEKRKKSKNVLIPGTTKTPKARAKSQEALGRYPFSQSAKVSQSPKKACPDLNIRSGHLRLRETRWPALLRLPPTDPPRARRPRPRPSRSRWASSKFKSEINCSNTFFIHSGLQAANTVRTFFIVSNLVTLEFINCTI